MEGLNQEGKQEGSLWSQHARCSPRREGTSSTWAEERQTESSSGPWQMGPNCQGFVSKHIAKYSDGLALVG